MLFLLLLLLSVSTVRRESEPAPLEFNCLRQQSRLSVRMYARSPEMVGLHALIRTSAATRQFHGALVIDTQDRIKYAHVLRNASVWYGRQLEVMTRGQHFSFSYHVAEPATHDYNNDGIDDDLYDLVQSARFVGAGMVGAGGGNKMGVSYDGVLMLDRYSAIWGHYNLMMFERARLTLAYGAVPEGATHHIDCDTTLDTDHCIVAPTTGLYISGAHWPGYRLVVNLDAEQNILPLDLFLWMQRHSASSIDITWGDNTTILSFDSRYQYVADATSRDVVIGTDLAHLLARLVYERETRQLHLWSTQPPSTTMRGLAIIPLLLALLHYFQWETSPGDLLMHYIVQFAALARTHYYYAYKQALVETGSVALALLVWLFVALDGTLSTAEPVHAQRTLLLLFVSFYHTVIAFVMLLLYPVPLRLAYHHYIRGWWHKPEQVEPVKRTATNDMPMYNAHLATVFDDVTNTETRKALYTLLVEKYHQPLTKQSVPVTLVRSTALVCGAMSNLVLMCNYYAGDNSLYLLVVVLLSLLLTYHLVKQVAVGVLYLADQEHAPLALFIAVQALVALAYAVGSTMLVYIDYFDALNSTYTSTIIALYCVSLASTAVLIGFFMGTNPLVTYMKKWIAHQKLRLYNEKNK